MSQSVWVCMNHALASTSKAWLQNCVSWPVICMPEIVFARMLSAIIVDMIGQCSCDSCWGKERRGGRGGGGGSAKSSNLISSRAPRRRLYRVERSCCLSGHACGREKRAIRGGGGGGGVYAFAQHTSRPQGASTAVTCAYAAQGCCVRGRVLQRECSRPVPRRSPVTPGRTAAWQRLYSAPALHCMPAPTPPAPRMLAINILARLFVQGTQDACL